MSYEYTTEPEDFRKKGKALPPYIRRDSDIRADQKPARLDYAHRKRKQNYAPQEERPSGPKGA